MTGSWTIRFLAALSSAAILLMPAAAWSQARVASEHGFWKIVCDTPPGAQFEQCAIYQALASDTEQNAGISIVLLRPADGNGDLLRIQGPLGVLLPKGVPLEVDETEIGTAFYVRCLRDGCYADVNVDEKLIEVLKTGKTAIFKFFQTPEEGVGFPVNLEGFSEAYAALP